jgi:hypothetical protein
MTCKQTSHIKLTTAAMLERAPKAKSNLGKIWNPFFLSSALWWRGFHVRNRLVVRLCSLDSVFMKYPFFLHFNFWDVIFLVTFWRFIYIFSKISTMRTTVDFSSWFRGGGCLFDIWRVNYFDLLFLILWRLSIFIKIVRLNGHVQKSKLCWMIKEMPSPFQFLEISSGN